MPCPAPGQGGFLPPAPVLGDGQNPAEHKLQITGFGKMGRYRMIDGMACVMDNLQAPSSLTSRLGQRLAECKR